MSHEDRYTVKQLKGQGTITTVQNISNHKVLAHNAESLKLNGKPNKIIQLFPTLSHNPNQGYHRNPITRPSTWTFKQCAQ
jgi:hypothetical protein